MRILFVTNYYPPCEYAGGYAQLCEEVADGLFALGHAVAVLTSTYGGGGEVGRLYPVHRLLPIDPDWHSSRLGAWQFFVGRRQREGRAVAHMRQLVAQHCPDVVFVWHTLGLPRLMLQEVERLPNSTTAYYLADYMPEQPDEHITYWQAPAVHWMARLLKRPLAKLALLMLAWEGKPIPLQYENAICVSEYLRRRLVTQELISPSAIVIHNGVNLSCFSSDLRDSSEFPSAGLRCLVAGRVVPDKGIHTVIEALAHLNANAQLDGITLTILGDGPADYVEYLRKRVCDDDLEGVVKFQSPVPRALMPQVLGDHDVLLLPSEYDEPLARAAQEAMAMGLLVIGTTTGGSGELLAHEKTGLVFEPGNPASLAAQLSHALHAPDRAVWLASAGQQAVEKEFDIKRTIDQIEGYVLGLVECAGADRKGRTPSPLPEKRAR